MRARFGSPAANVLLASAIVALVVLFCVNTWDSDSQQQLPLSWRSVPAIAIVLGVVVARALRRGVIVGDHSLVERRLLFTQYLWWHSLQDLRFETGGHRLSTVVDAHRVSILADHPRDGVSLRDAVVRATAEPDRTRAASVGRAVRHPSRAARCFTYGLLASVALVLTGTAVYEEARRDDAVYRARNARDVRGVADVVGWHVDEDDHGEGPTTYNTRVAIEFRHVGRLVETTIHRPGRHSYLDQEQIEIVYDPQHPHDADFGTRLNRRANDASVRLRLWVGPTLFAIGIVGSVVLAGIVLVSARRATADHTGAHARA